MDGDVWVDRVLTLTARIVVFGGSPIAAHVLYRNGPTLPVLSIWAGILLVSVVAFRPALDRGVRGVLTVAAPLLGGVGAVSSLGPTPGSSLTFCAAAILAAIAFGRRAGLMTLGLGVALFFVFGMANRDVTSQQFTELTSPLVWVRLAATLGVLGAVIVLLAHGAIEGAERGRRAAQAALGDRQRAETARLAAQDELLRLATSDFIARGDLEAALREITEAAARLLDAARCSVWRLAPDAEAIECLDLFAKAEARHSRPERIDSSSCPAYFAALRQERTIVVSDAVTDVRTIDLRDGYLVPLGITAMLDAPFHVGGKVAGVLCHEHIGAGPRPWTPEEQTVAGSLADCVSRAFETAERVRAERALERAYEELSHLQREGEAAKEDERRHIARELHDELGQMLTAIKLSLHIGNGERASTIEAMGLADRAIQTVRALSRSLRPPLLDELGVSAALQAHLQEHCERAGVAFVLEMPPDLGRLSAEVETALFRLVQEALTNVLRHAHASQVVVQVRLEDPRIHLTIRDNGVGFDLEGVLARARAGAHLGIVGMRERARALGGTFVIQSAPDRGTKIQVELPRA